MPNHDSSNGTKMSRRMILTAAAAGSLGLTQNRAVAQQQCPLGPPQHERGPRVFLDYDQIELDSAYNQAVYAPLMGQILKRFVSNSDAARTRMGEPRRASYGPTEVEHLDIYRTGRAKAPIFLYLHGGAWLSVDAAKNYAFAAEMFVNAGAHFVAPEFISVDKAGGDLQVMADQVRRAIAWTYKNAASFDGDPDRLFIAGIRRVGISVALRSSPTGRAVSAFRLTS